MTETAPQASPATEGLPEPFKPPRWLTHWHLLKEAHASDCTCSYCARRLWPFLWLPEAKHWNSWTVLALPWFHGSRLYFRVSGIFWGHA